MGSNNTQNIVQRLVLFKDETTDEDEYYTIEITSIRPIRSPYHQAQRRRYLRLGLIIIAVNIILAGISISAINYIQSRSTTINVGSPLWTYSDTGMFADTLNWSADSTQLSFPTRGFTETQMYNLNARRLMQYPDISRSIYQQANTSQEIELSPDGSYVVSIDYNATNHLKRSLSIWDTLTGKLLFRYSYHGKPATGEEIISQTQWWSTDNTQMATLDNDGSLIIWQASSGKPPFRLYDMYVPFSYVSWSANRKELAASTESGHVEIWDLTKKARISVGLVSPTISSLTFSPNAQRLAALDNDSLYLLSTYPGTITVDNALSLPIINGAPVIWSANSQYVIVTGKDDDNSTPGNIYSVAVWDVTASRQIMTTPVLQYFNDPIVTSTKDHNATLQILQHNDETVSVSPNRRYMATLEGNRNAIDVWEISTGRKVSTHYGSINNANHLFAWSPDGKYLAGTFKNNEMHIWNALTGTDVMIFNKASGIKNTSSASIQAIQWSPDTSYIAISNAYLGKASQVQYTIAIWNTPLD
jgi:WD40 repeat protein